MPFEFKPAKIENVSLVGGIAGASGSGKTYTGMMIAQGLVGPDNRFAVIDADARRAKHYARQFRFDHAEINAPFRPERFLEAIRDAEAAGYKAILIDNWSASWAGEGGMHDFHEDELQRFIDMDNKRQERYNKPKNDEDFLREKYNSNAWTKPKVEYKATLQRILQSKAHLIFCLRAEDKLRIEVTVDERTGRKKTEYIQGKDLPPRERWVPICCHSPEFTFELTFSFILTPEQPGVPIPIKIQEQHRGCFPSGDNPVSEKTGELLARWANGEEILIQQQRRQEPDRQPRPPPPTTSTQSESSPPLPPPAEDRQFPILLPGDKMIGEDEIEPWRDRFCAGIEKNKPEFVEVMLQLNAQRLTQMEIDYPEEVAAVREAFKSKIGRGE